MRTHCDKICQIGFKADSSWKVLACCLHRDLQMWSGFWVRLLPVTCIGYSLSSSVTSRRIFQKSVLPNPTKWDIYLFISQQCLQSYYVQWWSHLTTLCSTAMTSATVSDKSPSNKRLRHNQGRNQGGNQTIVSPRIFLKHV